MITEHVPCTQDVFDELVDRTDKDENAGNIDNSQEEGSVGVAR